MPTHNGRVLPLFKLLRWGGLNFKNGKVVDSAEHAINMSRALSYGTITQAQQLAEARAQNISRDRRHCSTILDQIDGRVCRLFSAMHDMKHVIMEYGWPVFWQRVLDNLSWGNVDAGAPSLNSSNLEIFAEALAQARARVIHNERFIHPTVQPTFIPSLNLWLKFLEQCYPDRYPDWKIAEDDTCAGQPVNDLEVIFPNIAREHAKRRAQAEADGDAGERPGAKRRKKRALAKKAKRKAVKKEIEESMVENIMTAMKQLNEEPEKTTEETTVEVKKEVTED